MEKEKKILIKYVLYILVGLFIIIYGMFHKVPITFALTNQNTIQFYDNNGNGANWVTTNYISQIQRSEATFTTQAGSYGGLVLAMLPTPVNTNHTYSIFLSVGAESNGGYTELSSKNCIGLGNTFAEAINSYVRCDYTPVYSRGSGQTGDYTRGLFWIFNSRQSASYIALPYTTQYTCTNCLQYSYGMEIQDNGDYTTLDETELNTAITNQTNSIDTTIANMQTGITNSITQGNNSILQNSNTNKQEIINNQNATRQAIIDNQNSNNQAILDQNKETFNDCIKNYFPYPYLFSNQTLNGITFTINSDKSITISGTATQQFFQNIARLTPNQYFTDNVGSPTTCQNGYCLSDTRYIGYTNNSGSIWFYFASGRTYNYTLKPMITKDTIPSEYIVPQSEKCTNIIKEQEKTSKGILGKLTDFFNTMFSNDDADVSGLNNMVGWLPPGPVDSIINLPLSLFNSLMNTITGTCSPIVLTLPFVNRSLTLPCFNSFMSQYLTGFSTLWTLIGTILSVFILYRYLLSLYKWIDDTLTLRENNLPGYYDDNWGGGA